MNRKEATMCPYFVRIKTKSSYSRKFTGVLRIFLDPFLSQYILLSFGTTLKLKKKIKEVRQYHVDGGHHLATHSL